MLPDAAGRQPGVSGPENWATLSPVTTPQDYATTFGILDTDGDGLISATELKALMLALGEDITDDAAVAAVRIMDEDGDGLISLDELAGYLSSRAAQQP
jgi:Ca2+-binding EF-hand superfamily protein